MLPTSRRMFGVSRYMNESTVTEVFQHGSLSATTYQMFDTRFTYCVLMSSLQFKSCFKLLLHDLFTTFIWKTLAVTLLTFY